MKASHITPPVIRDWQAQAMLACAIPSLRGFDAQVLVACGVRDLEDLAAQDADTIVGLVDDYLHTSDGKQLARSSKPASRETVQSWIAAAQAGRRLRRPQRRLDYSPPSIWGVSTTLPDSMSLTHDARIADDGIRTFAPCQHNEIADFRRRAG